MNGISFHGFLLYVLIAKYQNICFIIIQMLVNQYNNFKGIIIFTNALIGLSSRSLVIFNNALFFSTLFKQLQSSIILGITLMPSRISSWTFRITTYLASVISVVITKIVNVFISNLGIIFFTCLCINFTRIV